MDALPAVLTNPSLSQAGATIALRAASLHPTALDHPMSIAVVDAHTHLVSFTRHSLAKHCSIALALDMARTAASTRLPTSALAEAASMSDSGSPSPSPAPSMSSSTSSTRPGGIPILSPTGVLLGAIACATGTSVSGEEAAAAGRDAVVSIIASEAAEEERRVGEEREEVLRLWREKEEQVRELREEVEGLRGELEYVGGGKRRKMSAVNVVGAPDTPPEEGEFVAASFVGEVRVDGF